MIFGNLWFSQGFGFRKGKKNKISILQAMWSEPHNEFFFWLKQQDKEYLLKTDIITLRNKFYSGKSE